MSENVSKSENLAKDILTLSRNTLLVNFRFLDMALSRFEFVPCEKTTLATDGKHFCYNPMHILQKYKNEKEVITRDFLHIMMHCVFQHMFMSPSIDRACWDLACDIAVEAAISDLSSNCVNSAREAWQKAEIAKLKAEVKHLTAEKIYRYYLDLNLSPSELANLRGMYYADDHTLWYMTVAEISVMLGISENQSGSESDNNSGSGGGSSDGSIRTLGEDGTSKSALAEDWKNISERMQVDMMAFSNGRYGTSLGLIQNLKEVNREKYDYTEFLKKFAVMCEAMKINDDEFDYIFYTYGLKLYDKMPLIEPLEYKEVKRIKEFVLVIDTSGSVVGDLVQAFVQKTYNVLKSTESFFSKINLHIIQCDDQIQEDVKITSQEEFDNYLANMTLKGFGGNDEVRMFSYVDELIKKGEFTNLKGMIYFTDGYGIFPKKKPDYEVAFVFVENDRWEIPDDIPPWAIKLILQEEEI